MPGKLTLPAPAAENDPANLAEPQRHAEKYRQKSAPDLAEDLAQDSAEYIAVLASQLQRMAETNGQEFLAYLIDMVVVEAWRIAGPDADHRKKKADKFVGGRV